MNNLPTSKQFRRGLTLVEMMISVVLTLMVVFAVVRVFESLGENVTDGRATIEMSGNMRTASQLLQGDLNGLTTTTLPPRSPSHGEGYIELLDGISTDSQYPYVAPAGGPDLLRLAAIGTDGDQDGFLEQPYDTCVGDIDDILAFTSHRADEQFQGTISDPRVKSTLTGAVVQSHLAPTAIIKSNDAEIVWWLQVERAPNEVGLETLTSERYLGHPKRQIALATGAIDVNGNVQAPLDQYSSAQRYPNELGTPVRSLHRRVLLIRPDMNLSDVKLFGQDEVDQFLSNNDISVRVVRDVAGASNQYKVIANSLADLTDRENRAYRNSWKTADRSKLEDTRLLPARVMGELLNPAGALPRQAAMKDMVLQYPLSLYGGGSGMKNVIMLRKGDDVVLSDVLAFDLKVWDALAPVLAKEGVPLSPHDPGYLTSGTAKVSLGSFVDLGFADYPKVPKRLTSASGHFAFGPAAKSHLTIPSQPINLLLNAGFDSASYCTWSSTYEHDGINQDSASDPMPDMVDEGFDGLDNDGILGVDDPGELETSPPYPHALRGLKITLRTIDFGTRQVRQSSITKDFLPE